MFKKILVTTIAVIIIAGATILPKAHADDNIIGLAISPLLKEISLNPGESASGVVKVTNSTKVNLNIAVTVKDFRALGEEGSQAFIDPEENTSGYSMAKWVTLEKSFSLMPSETKEISYKVDVPNNAEPGGHYGVIFFTPSLVDSSSTVSGSGAVVVPQMGSLLLVTVPGEITYGGKIAEFSTNKKIYFDTNNNIDLFTRFQNLSTVHIKPTGTITIKNIFGNTVGVLTVNAQEGNVLPDSIRKFTSEWTKKYGFGPYNATVNMTFGSGESATGNLSFWIIPWKITTAGLILLIIVIWLISRLQWKKK
jgi:hypothetical protein